VIPQGGRVWSETCTNQPCTPLIKDVRFAGLSAILEEPAIGCEPSEHLIFALDGRSG
jgi:hypothetical protein